MEHKGAALKQRLFTPGPTPLPEQVRLAQAREIVHHRGKEFAEVFKEVRQGLQYVFQTQEDVFVFTASGTGAMEAAMANLLSPGDKILVIKGGKFGERWADMATAFGVQVIPLHVKWGSAPDPGLIKKKLVVHQEIKAVFTQLVETSTGVVYDIKAIAELVKTTEAILVVDAISGLGAQFFPTGEWGIDVVIGGSQKALMMPPGLAFVTLSPTAWSLVENSHSPRYYWDFRKVRKALDKNQTPYTPAVSLICALRESLRLLRKEDWKNILARHARLAEATRKAALALELKIFGKIPSNVVTAIEVPAGIDANELRTMMRDEYGVEVAGGQGKLAGKIIRIAHLGWMDGSDMITAVSSLEISLSKLGYPVTLGKGVAAAEQILKE